MDQKNNQLISRSDDCFVRVWDVRTHRCVQVIAPRLPAHTPSLRTRGRRR